MKSRIVLATLLVAAMCSTGFAAEFWVIKDTSGKLIIVEEKPADTEMVVKGPFASRADAEVIISGPVAMEGTVEGRVGPAPVAPAPVPAPAPVKPAPPVPPISPR